MIWLSEHWLQLAFISLYLAMLVHHAVVGRRQVHRLDDYLVAGRSLGGWVVALSFYATFMSTNTFIGAAGKSWDVGLVWCVGGVVLVGLCCISWWIVAPRFVPLTKEYGSLTVADFLGYHYHSSTVRRVAAVIVCVASVIYLVAIFKGAAIALEMMLGVPYVWSVLLIFVVVTSYTLAGGFKSVVLTDAVQGLLMFAGAVAMVVAVLAVGGGLPAILADLRSQDPDLVSWSGKQPLAAVFSYSLAVGLKYLVEPRQLSRFYGLRDTSALKLASVVTPLLVLLTYFCLLPIGALAHALIPAGEIDTSDRIVPYLLHTVQVFGPIMSSFFLVVLLSAAMSSIDSVLLVSASAIDHDLIAPNDTGSRAVRRTRIWVVVVSLLTTAAALSPFTADIVAITSLSGSLYGACFLPALVVGIFWRRSTATAALASFACGSVAVVTCGIARKFGWLVWHEVYLGVAVGMVVFIVVSWLGPKNAGIADQGEKGINH